MFSIPKHTQNPQRIENSVAKQTTHVKNGGELESGVAKRQGKKAKPGPSPPPPKKKNNPCLKKNLTYLVLQGFPP